MKKLTIFFASLFFSGMVLAQIPGVYNPNANPTVTPEQIKAWGLASQQNQSSITVLDFEGCPDYGSVGNYYNGGGGPNYGIYFGGNTLSLVDADAGGSGNFANEPSPNTVMFFLSGAATTMNVTAGFTTGFSYYYTSSGTGQVQVYDGLDGTGNLLATQSFPANYNVSCTGDPTGTFCRWDVVAVPFAGTAKSVVFTGVANQCAFDDVTFGSLTPGGGGNVPTLTEWGLIILGMALLGFGTFYILRMRS